MTAITNTKIILEDGIIWDGRVLTDGGVITAAGRACDVDIPAGADVIDAHRLYTAPGLIDIHDHGSDEKLFHEDPAGCCRRLLEHGVTRVLPTLYCDMTVGAMMKAASALKEASKSGYSRIISGLYMEGPYMGGFGSNQDSILHTGGIYPEEYEPLLDAVAGFAKVWAIDPARPGIEGFMRDVKEKDPSAIFAMGHSHATAADCRRVRKYGLRLQTHHGDSGKAKGRNQVTVGAGCDEFTLYDPDVWAEIICDENGIHLDPDLVRMVLRTKGVERVILISDSMPDRFHTKNNEADGVLYGPDLNYDREGHLAGSRLTLDAACRNVMAHTGCGICQAVRMASLNPARLLGIDGECGSIEPGKRADLILTDDEVSVKSVFFGGERLF